jgi:hypothetical protein
VVVLPSFPFGAVFADCAVDAVAVLFNARLVVPVVVVVVLAVDVVVVVAAVDVVVVVAAVDVVVVVAAVDVVVVVAAVDVVVVAVPPVSTFAFTYVPDVVRSEASFQPVSELPEP